MSELSTKNAATPSLYTLVGSIPRDERIKLLEGCDLKTFERIFNDADMMAALDCLFDNNLNVSETARKMYMHRNTLIYRLNKFRELTGLNACAFSDAVTFILISKLFSAGKEGKNG